MAASQILLDESRRAHATQALLADMHPLSQFAAARQLHREMRDQGESPERLADLARAYANLGVLTEHLWFTGHKAFKARALLYAERGTNRWLRSPVSLSGRAYARALVGLHQAALDDLAAAKTLGEGASPEEAAEAVIVERFCRFTLGQLDDADAAVAQRPLVRLLKLLSVDRYSGTAQVLDTANLVLEAVPDSDRAIDAIYETRRLGTRGQAVSLGLERTPQGLYRRLLRWDDLPARVGMLVSEAGGDDEPAERERRLELIRALRASGEIGSDASEPSWQAMASWIEEVAFLQTVRNYEYLFRSLSVPLDSTRAELEPLLADHPYRTFLESLCDNRAQRRERVKDFLAALRPADVSMNEFFAWEYVASFTPQEGHPLQSLAMKHQDWTYRDLLLTSHRSRELFWAENSSHLRRVSPNSPLTIAATIQYDWEFAAPQAADWERIYADSPQVQGALGRQYVKQEKYESAVRCLQRQATLQPEFESYRPLAEALLKLGNEQEWLATWNEFLQQEDFGLTHARARVTVAEHFMLQGRWDEAWPYAEAAAALGRSGR